MLNYNTVIENGFDIITPEKVKLERKENGKWCIKYLSNKTLEWIEDPNEPEVKVSDNKKTPIYRTIIYFQEGETSKEYILYRTEEGEKITHNLVPNISNFVNERKGFGVINKTPIKHIVKELDESLADITNWKHISNSFIQKNPFYFDNSGVWWRWNNNKYTWEITDETDLLIAVDKATKKNTLPSGEKSKAMEALRREARELCPVPVSDNWVQFGEVVVDVETGERFSASPKYFITNPIPWSIGSDITTPTIDKYLKEWAGERAQTLKQLLAFCCLPSYPIQRIFFLIGGGSNGKSTFLTVLRKFIGMNNVCSAGFDEITDSSNKFATSALYKKTVCEMGETGFTSVKKTEILKRLSSGQDLTKAEFKGKGQFEFINYAKIVIASNSLPETHDKTDGFYRRWVIIDFPNQFEEKKNILAEIPDEEYNNLALWSINELQNLLRERKFYKEGSIAERKEEYEKRSDPLGDFIKRNYEPSGAFETESSTFYAEYEKYAVSRSIRVMSYRVWKAEMQGRGYQFERKRTVSSGDNPVSVIIGLKKKENNDYPNFVPVVSVVSDTSPIYEKNILNRRSDTTGTTDTEAIKSAICLKPLGNAQILETIFGRDKIERWLQQGIIVEIPAGTYRLV